MATYYVWSGATGSANGTSWANAYTTLTTAFSGKVAGDVFYVAHDHAEATANLTLSAPGSLTSPAKIICVNRAGSVPPVSADRRTTATIASTTNTNMFLSGSAHYDGIIFNCGSGAVSSALLGVGDGSNLMQRLDNCSLRLVISTGNCYIYLGSSTQGNTGTLVELNNTTLSFANSSQQVRLLSAVRWRNTPSALLGTIPTSLFYAYGFGGSLECIGVDLSAMGSGKTLITNQSQQSFRYNFVDCKLDAAVTKAGSFTGFGVAQIDFVRSGAAGVNYAVSRVACAGTLDQETTIIRTGGASDGTTPISWKVVTNANSNYTTSFECPPIAIWNDTVGLTVTATVEGIWGGGAVPNDNDVWIDVEYLGDASSPQASFINDGTADLLTAAAAQTSSSATWGGSTTKFKLNVSFTAQQKGWIYARVKCAKASSTFYIDPFVTLT